MSEEGAEIQLSKEEYALDGLVLILNQRNASQSLTHLKLHLNYHPAILKQISTLHPSFTHLVFLNLSFNNITSLEPLRKFNLPHLNELHLFHNNISSLRTLRKCSLPCLRMISIVNNCIGELGGVAEWNCPKLTQFFAYDNNIELSINSIIKMNCNGLAHIMTNEDAVERHELAQYCYYVRFDNYKVS